MRDNEVFDRLVAELTTEERLDFLNRIRGDAAIPEILPGIEEEHETAIESAYGSPGFLEKIILFFVSIFSGRSQQEVRESMVFKKASRELERRYPDIISFRQGLLLNGFKASLKNLASGFQIFTEPLQQINGTTKEEFFAFLGSLEMPDLHKELLTVLELLTQEDVSATSDDPAALKRDIEFRLEDLLNTIDKGEHDNMYMNARQIAWLRSMAFFPFSRILSEFENVPGEEDTACYINKVNKFLSELADIVSSYPIISRETLFESLVSYRYREEINKGDMDIERVVKDFIVSAGRALEHYRYFMEHVPLTQIIRIYRRNTTYFPKRSTGGEDWYLHFRQFWLNRLNEKYLEYLRMKELKDLLAKASAFIKQNEISRNTYYRSGTWDYGVGVKYEKSFSFLRDFYHTVYLVEMNPVLKIVLIDGEFYKDQNREDFTEAYNQITRIVEELTRLEDDLSERGVRGKAIAAAAAELIPQPNREKKIQSILDGFDTEVKRMLNEILQHLDMLEKVLKGIVYGEKGGRFDTLSNIGYLGKQSKVGFLVRLSAVHKKTETAIGILHALLDIESGRSTVD